MNADLGGTKMLLALQTILMTRRWDIPICIFVLTDGGVMISESLNDYLLKERLSIMCGREYARHSPSPCAFLFGISTFLMCITFEVVSFGRKGDSAHGGPFCTYRRP